MTNIIKGTRIRVYRAYKQLYQDLFFKKHRKKNILFIVGCQRSGTTLLTRIFERDFAVKVYKEVSKLSSLNEVKTRLNPLPLVKKEIEKNNVKTVVLKPLVESQNIDFLFEAFENSKALWVYRHYKDVAASNLKKFGPDQIIANLTPIVNQTEGNWRSERVSESTRALIAKFYSEDMSHQDASALFWYVRNQLFFDRSLVSDPRVRLCKYEELVTDPQRIMRQVYFFMGATFPKRNIIGEVHKGSIKKGKDIDLSADIDSLCQTMLSKLDKVYLTQEN